MTASCAGRPVEAVRSRFFVWMAVALAVTVLWGFAPTYFLRAFITTRDLNLLVHVHGFIFSCWIALFITQTTLVATHRTESHRRMGVAGVVLAVAVIGLGIAVDLASLTPAQEGRWEAIRGPVASFAWLATRNAGNVMIFGVLVGAAVYWRRRPEVHKRLMLIGCLAVMDAPLARILDEWGWPIVLSPFGFLAPGSVFVQTVAPLIAPPGLFNLVVLPFFLALVAHDVVTTRRLHVATWCGGSVLFLFQPLFVVVLALTQR